MACRECQERRERMIDAVLEGRILAVSKHAVLGVAEMAGIKPKADTKQKPRAKRS